MSDHREHGAGRELLVGLREYGTCQDNNQIWCGQSAEEGPS